MTVPFRHRAETTLTGDTIAIRVLMVDSSGNAGSSISIGDVGLDDAAGNAINPSAAYAEDSAHATGHWVTPMGGVRTDTRASIGGSTGDYVPPQMTASGDMRVRDDDLNTDSDTMILRANTLIAATGGTTSTKADVDGNGSAIAHLRRIGFEADRIGDKTDNIPAKGTAAMAASTPVTIATDDTQVTAIKKTLVGASAPTIDSYSTAVVNCAAAANQVLVADPGASKQIWVYGFIGHADVAGTLTFQDEDDTALSGTMPIAAHGAFVVHPSGNFNQPWLKCTTNKALELDCATCTIDGIIAYAIVSV